MLLDATLVSQWGFVIEAHAYMSIFCYDCFFLKRSDVKLDFALCNNKR